MSATLKRKREEDSGELAPKREAPGSPLLDVPAKLATKKKRLLRGRLRLTSSLLIFEYSGDKKRAALEIPRSDVTDCISGKGKSGKIAGGAVLKVVAVGGSSYTFSCANAEAEQFARAKVILLGRSSTAVGAFKGGQLTVEPKSEPDGGAAFTSDAAQAAAGPAVEPVFLASSPQQPEMLSLLTGALRTHGNCLASEVLSCVERNFDLKHADAKQLACWWQLSLDASERAKRLRDAVSAKIAAESKAHTASEKTECSRFRAGNRDVQKRALALMGGDNNGASARTPRASASAAPSKQLLSATDFWSDDALRHRRYVEALEKLVPEASPALPDDRDSIFPIHLGERMRGRVLARERHLHQLHAQLVGSRHVTDREFWQHYVSAKHQLQLADDEADMQAGTPADIAATERRRAERFRQVRAAVEADSVLRFEQELHELGTLDTQADAHMALFGVRSRWQRSEPYAYTEKGQPGKYAPHPCQPWGYGLQGENAHRIFDRRGKEVVDDVSRPGDKGRRIKKQGVDLLRQLNLWGDYVLECRPLPTSICPPAQPWLGEQGGRNVLCGATGRIEDESRTGGNGGQVEPEGSIGANAEDESKLANLEVFTARYCYTRAPHGHSNRNHQHHHHQLAPPQSNTAANTNANTDNGDNVNAFSWVPNAKRRITEGGAAAGQEAAPLGATRRTDVATGRNTQGAGAGGAGWSNVGGSVGGCGDGTGSAGLTAAERELERRDAETRYKAQLVDAMTKIGPCLTHFWAAIQSDNRAKAERFHTILEELYDEVDTINEALPPRYKSSLQPLSKVGESSLHGLLNRAFSTWQHITSTRPRISS